MSLASVRLPPRLTVLPPANKTQDTVRDPSHTNRRPSSPTNTPTAVILTCWHLVFATLATQLLSRTTSLLDGRHKIRMTGRTYLRAVVPIGVFYSASLVCSNLVYLYLNVAFIQMLKAGGPIAVLVISYFWGVSRPTGENVVNVVGIAVGVALASAGEVQFSWVGFMFQVGGIVFEAMRLVMIQILLSGDDMKMDPLVSLYYYAPVCGVMNFAVALFTEFPSFQMEDLYRTGLLMLVLNALVAFMLNIASVFLVGTPQKLPEPPGANLAPQIGKTSSLVLTLAGILKAILLVAFSILFRAEHISLLQFCGYTVALFGLVYYSLGRDQLKNLGTSTKDWVSSNFDDNKVSPTTRRVVTVVALGLVLVLAFLGLRGGDGEMVQAPITEGWGFGWMSKLGWSR